MTRSRPSPTCSASSRARRACMTGSAAGEYLPGHTCMIRRDPVGVVASIAPWNYPLMMAAWKMAPGAGRRQHGGAQALRADAADRAASWRELAAEIFPPGVINIVFGRGETVGAPLVTHPQVRMVSLTGVVATGAKVLQRRRQRKRTHLELGGKAPVIVFDDADIERGRRHPHLRLLQRGPGLHGRVPHLRAAKDLRQAGGGSSARRSAHQGGSAGGSGVRDGAADHRAASRPRRRLRRARRRTVAHPPDHRWHPDLSRGAQEPVSSDRRILGKHEYGGLKVSEVSLNGFSSGDIAARVSRPIRTVSSSVTTISRPATTTCSCTPCTWTSRSPASRRCKRYPA